MKQSATWAAMWACFACLPASAAADEPAPPPAELSAVQIVEKNVAARGGLEAWKKVQTMAWVGHIENTLSPAARLPFVLEQKRPNKTRFEIKAQNQLSLRIFDGTNGWKLRPSANGKPEVQTFSDTELRFAQDGQVIDGPLMDYAAKGVAIALEGIEAVEGRPAYRLKIRLPSGSNQHVWVDTQSFLDIKYEHPSKTAFGQPGPLAMFYRDFRDVDGLQMPMTIETGSDTAKAPGRMIIDRVAVNPPLEDRVFAKPYVPGQHSGAMVDTRAPPPQLRQADRTAPSLLTEAARPPAASLPAVRDAP